MKRIHQNRPKEGIFLKNNGGLAPQTPHALCARQGKGDFSVIHDSERCVL